VAGIYAAGDMTTVPFKQIIIASGDGAKAAMGGLRPPDPVDRSGCVARGISSQMWPREGAFGYL